MDDVRDHGAAVGMQKEMVSKNVGEGWRLGNVEAGDGSEVRVSRAFCSAPAPAPRFAPAPHHSSLISLFKLSEPHHSSGDALTTQETRIFA